jgi:creatinine amidohydrolase
MKKIVSFSFFIYLGIFLHAQNLPTRYEELTAPDFITAVEKSSETCIIPIGVFEKHGAHLPLGTDLFIAREVALRAAEKDYTVVYPWYYFSQINEAKHQPGTVAYSPELIWKMLQETLDELARNGFKKIIIVNGHGGNNAFLNYFGMAQLSENRKYSLYVFQPKDDREALMKAEKIAGTDSIDAHAGFSETSMIKAIKPEIVHTERANEQSGENLDRIKQLQNIYTGIWWYASFPNHYGGNGTYATVKAGEFLFNEQVGQLMETIRSVKADTVVPALEDQFYKDSENPLKTKQ